MKNKIIIISGIVLLLSLVSIVIVLNLTSNNKQNKSVKKKKKEVKVEKKINVVDINNDSRPYAVMINNHNEARPQAGLDKAYIIYEFMVEGGITRLMALYTPDINVEKIGAVRSSRHYYLDYAMENDAIYVHWGTSIFAEKDIASLGINNIDGMIYSDKYFITDSSLNRSLEHTRFTSSELVEKGVNEIGYRTKREKDYLLKYTTDIIDLSKKDGTVANTIVIKYSDYMTANYLYNNEDKMYYRSINNNPMTDLVTNEQYKFKNIIAYQVDYHDISSYGHQDIYNIGEGEGYYFTNGYGVKIKWKKDFREGQTKYYYMDGTEINFSDGNTFIQVYPNSGMIVYN